MFELDKKKIIIGCMALVLIIATIFLVIYSKRSNEDEKKKYKENNYTLVFTKKENNRLVQKMEFVYRNKKLKTIYLTIYFIDKSVVKIVADEYKSTEEFADVSYKDDHVKIKYKESDNSEYESMSKNDLIDYMNALGFALKK